MYQVGFGDRQGDTYKEAINGESGSERYQEACVSAFANFGWDIQGSVESWEGLEGPYEIHSTVRGASATDVYALRYTMPLVEYEMDLEYMSEYQVVLDVTDFTDFRTW